MSPRFQSSVAADSVSIQLIEKRLIRSDVVWPWRDWYKAADHRRTVRRLGALVDANQAQGTPDAVILPSLVAAALPADIADAIALPPLVELGLVVALEGRVETADGTIRLRWTDRSARQVRPARHGIELRWGERSGRVSAPILRLLDAAEGYNNTLGQGLEARIAAWMPMQKALAAVTNQEVKRDGFLETFTIYQAGAFALDFDESGDFLPLLLSRGQAPSLEDDAPADDIDDPRTKPPPVLGGASVEALLPADDQREFARAFTDGSATRDAYRVGRNRYVLVDTSLKRALDVVRSKRRAARPDRDAFLRNPRAALADALCDGADEMPTTSLFVETESYSDRIEGLGLWEPPKIPWMSPVPNGWLPEGGWTVDGDTVEPSALKPEEIDAIEREYEAAEIRGDSHVVIRGRPIPIDAVPKLLMDERARTERAAAEERARGGAADETRNKPERLVLVIVKTNLDGVDYELTLRPRRAVAPAEPPADRMGKTALKPHQAEGFLWLVEAWQSGWPGVLLADDMGLGKTFQTLAFMAWLKSNEAAASGTGAAGTLARPILVVAPTALLSNWRKEAAERLAPGGLGEPCAAYGSALAKLKLNPGERRHGEGETLSRDLLRDSGWILTTYETLTDHERAFAPIPYSLVVFDEMQKVKAPDTLNTKAAKALNADFVVGLTGTPIENRMEDLWCLFDRLTPGYLGDLKSFSSRFSGGDADALIELKRRLDQPVETAPAILKRRMKSDILVGLPEKKELRYAAAMPDPQATAYRQLVREAGGSRDRSPGFMLKVLHQMRGICLHPDDAGRADVSSPAAFLEFAARSSRLETTVGLLSQIRDRREKALVFIEYLAMQEVLAEGVATLFDLPARPSIINGATPGERRLAIVDRFMASADGFGLLVLSPRAAGVGLNITAATHVIHLSRWWNPAVEDQCNDRAHRLGQTRPVTVHIPIATHPEFVDATFDEKLDALLTRKRELSRHMLAPPTSESDVGDLFGATVRD